MIRYRVAMINDFKGVTTFVDYQKWGITEILNAAEIKSPLKGYQDKNDGIYIFLNFNQVAVVKSKSEAVSLLNRLIADCPREARKDYEEYKEILFRSLL